MFRGFFLFSFYSILIEYYNEVVNHSNYENRYALCFLIPYSIKSCNEPPPRGLRTGKRGKMYAAMIYIGRMRV